MHSTVKFDYSRRTRILNIAVTALYFLILGLVLYELDRQHYTGEKEAIIRENFREIFNLPDTLADYAGDVLFSANPTVRQAAAQRLREEMERIVQGPTSILSFELPDSNRQVVEGLKVIDPDKPRRLNTWRNSLFLRNFERITDLGVKRERGLPSAGRLVARYTSPPRYPPIEALTRRYWLIAGGLVAIWCLGYFFLYRYLLRPMHNVTVHLQGAYQARPQLIRSPSAGLEAAYNQMALQAILQHVSETLSQLLHVSPKSQSPAHFLEEALAIVADAFDLDDVRLTEWLAQGKAPISVRRYHDPRQSPAHERGNSKNSAIAGKVRELLATGSEDPQFDVQPDGEFFFVSVMRTPAETLEGKSIVTIEGRLRESQRNTPWRCWAVTLACETVRRGLLAYAAFDTHRRQANISLARCIGHDLTNVLASVRLNTLTVSQILEKPPAELTDDEWELLREGVAAIADTMRLMQDIVDLYSSFSSIQKPEYKRCPLPTLVEDLLAKFERTTSLHVRFERDFGPEMPVPVIERRLLMLALFNVLTNALDAFRSMRDKPADEPCITVRTRFSCETQTFQIIVEDNGPGIRDREGRLLGMRDIEVIFHQGYSTKSELSEGFGLHWVRTIIEGFHKGSVRAENRPEGGARFILELHSMEEREATGRASL